MLFVRLDFTLKFLVAQTVRLVQLDMSVQLPLVRLKNVLLVPTVLALMIFAKSVQWDTILLKKAHCSAPVVLVGTRVRIRQKILSNVDPEATLHPMEQLVYLVLGGIFAPILDLQLHSARMALTH